MPVTILMKPSEPAGEDTTYSFSCTNGEILRTHPDADAEIYTVILSYLPVMRLSSPAGLSVNQKNILRWENVPHADRYMLRFYKGEDLTAIRIRRSTEFDISDFTAEGCTNVSVTALGPAGQTSIRDSASAKLELSPIQ